MTKLSYNVFRYEQYIANVPTYADALSAISTLGAGSYFKAVYTEFDPEDTEENINPMRKHAEKINNLLSIGKELSNSYVR